MDRQTVENMLILFSPPSDRRLSQHDFVRFLFMVVTTKTQSRFNDLLFIASDQNMDGYLEPSEFDRVLEIAGLSFSQDIKFDLTKGQRRISYAQYCEAMTLISKAFNE